MSNDLILREIQNSLATIDHGIDEDTRAVAGNASSKRISIKGGVFRKMVNGKEAAAIEDRHMNVIFVKLAHTPSRTYYTSGYVEGQKVSPTCWSNDSKTPDPEVKTPQASSCDQCQWSVKGTGQNGQGTACRLSWRTAVVLPSDPAGDVMQLVLPATSVFGKEDNGRWPFRAYVQMLASNNISASRVVTKMQFDTKAAVPRVLFSPVAAVTQDVVGTIVQQSKTKEAENAVRLTVYQTDEGEAPEVAQPVSAGTMETPSADDSVPEPKKRESSGPAAGEPKDVSELVKKWAGGKK